MTVRLALWWNAIAVRLNGRALRDIERNMEQAMVDKAQLTSDVQALVTANAALAAKVKELEAAQDFTDLDTTVKDATAATNAVLSPAVPAE